MKTGFNRKDARCANAFTLIEVLVVVTLLSFIVIALMAVFNATQTAFRASVTQSDVLEGGRAVMDLMTEDLKGMTAAGGNSNNLVSGLCPVNFCVTNYNNYQSLHQSLVGVAVSVPPTRRTNIVENFFILSSGNNNGVPTWYGTGYAVITNTPDGSTLYPLYRFSTNLPMAIPNSAALIFTNFQYFLSAPTNGSHLIDGVVGLRVHAFDANGALMISSRTNVTTNSMVFSVEFIPNEVGYVFYSNALPASVEIEMATLEDRTLQRAESLSGSYTAQTNYLAGQAGAVHVFRQRVSIPNFDPAAYQ